MQNMEKTQSYPILGLPKYIVGFVGTLAFRLVSPFLGLWNISPLMATEIAGAKAYGPIAGGIYGALSIALVDLFMGKIGSWTIVTALTYGVVGVGAGYFLKNRSATSYNFVAVSIAGTLFFDLITGVFMGPIFYAQPWMSAVLGQIPFTLRHLVGNVFFASVLSPWFYKKIMMNPKWELKSIFKVA